VLALAGAAFAVAGVTGQGLFDRVMSSAPLPRDAESVQAQELVDAGRTSSESVLLVVEGLSLSDAAQMNQVASAFADIREKVAGIEGVLSVTDPLEPSLCTTEGAEDVALCSLQNAVAAPLISAKRDGLLMVAELSPDLSADEQTQASRAVYESLSAGAGDLDKLKGVHASAGGSGVVLSDIIDQLKRDLGTSELIAFPLALIVMVLVFAGFLAASMPIAGAGVSILTAMGMLFGLTYLTDVHTSVVNIISVICLGLSIDYGLLVVSRFREELRHKTSGERRRGNPVHRALIATVTSAGRTVVYSALTIGVSVAGLMAFKAPVLRTYGLCGFIAVLLALGTAVTLVPALLALFGHHLTRPSIVTRIPGLKRMYAALSDVAPEEGFFSNLTARAQRHPWMVCAGVLAILGVLASPALKLELRDSTTELLPRGSDQRVFLEMLTRDYPQLSTSALILVSPGNGEAPLQEMRAFVEDKVQGLDHVKKTDLAQSVVERNGYVEAAIDLTVDDTAGPEARSLVGAIRGLVPEGMDVMVMGPTASLVDFHAELAEGAPWAALIVTLAALVLLFAMTGSVLIPIKALITNVLSLLAAFGIITWVFQQGHFASLLGFTKMAGIESYILVLIAIFGFGLAMDYEVFLISRIKEAYDAGAGSDESVRIGLQRSGRIITSAALIIVMVFVGFMAGQVVIVKEIGLGMAVVVALDATLVRMLLVPATMTILGKWNWWAPRHLRGLRDKIALREIG
jgi:RND superfamily putative drug exporter